MFGFVTWVQYNMEKKIMSMISNIVWMALFTMFARLEQTIQLLLAVFVITDDCGGGAAQGSRSQQVRV